MDRCPKKEIEELRKMIIVDYRGAAGGALKENVDHVFDKDLKVMSIRLIPLGLCAEQSTKVPKTTIQVHPGSTNQQSSKTASSDNGYLVTFIIPAVVIVCMILLAGIIACVLYRRRRTGKGQCMYVFNYLTIRRLV
jgi:dystroglycan 1